MHTICWVVIVVVAGVVPGAADAVPVAKAVVFLVETVSNVLSQ